MYTGIVFLSSESPAWKCRSFGIGHCQWAIGSRPVLVCRFRNVQKKNGVDLPRLEDEDTTLLRNVIVRLPTRWPSVVSSKNGTSATSAGVEEKKNSTTTFEIHTSRKLMQLMSSLRVFRNYLTSWSLFVGLFICLFVYFGLVAWLAGWLIGWLVGWLAGWLAGWLVVGWLSVWWLVGSRPFLIYCQ